MGIGRIAAFPPAPAFATCRGCGARQARDVSPLVADALSVDSCISGLGTDTTCGPQSAWPGAFGSRRLPVARDEGLTTFATALWLRRAVLINGGGFPLLCGLPQFHARRRDGARAASSPKVLRKGPDPAARLGLRGGGLPNRHLRTGARPLLTAGGLVGVGRHGRCGNRDSIVAGLCR